MASTNRKIVSVGISVLFIALVVAVLIAVLPVVWQLFLTYQETPFQKDRANRIFEKLERKQLAADAFGRVALDPADMELRGGTAYVTVLPDGDFELLLPSYMEHDSNVFGGYVFSHTHLNFGGSIHVLGPVRAASHGSRSRLLALTVDKQLSSNWYHVHGTWG